MSVTPKTANGWGSVHNGGITGGAGGIEIEFSDFDAMWDWLGNNLTIPAIVTYTGGDISFAGVSFFNSRRFKTGLKNKTIRASAGQKITLGWIRFWTNENIIWENWHHFDSQNDIIECFGSSINIWIRHCTLNANQADAAFPNYTGTTDGCIDITTYSDYIAITDCLFLNADKTSLMSSSNMALDDPHRYHVTYARNKFFQCTQRKPRGSFAFAGVQHNIFEFGNQFDFGSSKALDPTTNSEFWAYGNKFIDERIAFLNRNDSGALKALNNRFINTGGTTEIDPQNVTWNILTEPEYTIDTWTDAEMDAWIDQWAGATMHLMTDDEEEPTIPPVESGNRRFFARRNQIV
jgi:pectate lyase